MLRGSKLIERAAGIQLVVFDVDGVLSDGKITYTSNDQEVKNFNVKDGLGVSLAVRAGIQCGIITARESVMVQQRALDLGIQHVIQKTRTKLPAFEQLLASLNLRPEQAAFIGDDLPDIPPMQHAGLACCPADAAGEVKTISHLVANQRGGDGAVREIMEFLLECRQIVLSR